MRNAVVLKVFHFASFLELSFLLHYPSKVSIINSQVRTAAAAARTRRAPGVPV